MLRRSTCQKHQHVISFYLSHLPPVPPPPIVRKQQQQSYTIKTSPTSFREPEGNKKKDNPIVHIYLLDNALITVLLLVSDRI
jgi:hypothetical protein